MDRIGLVDVTDPEVRAQVAVQTFTLGFRRDVARIATLPLAAGIAFTVYDKPDVLDPVYGDSPTSAYGYVRLRA